MNELNTLAVIILFNGATAPQGWVFCEGQILSIAERQAVYSLLGTNYGGDGITNFALPKLSNVGNCHYIICLEGIYPYQN